MYKHVLTQLKYIAEIELCRNFLTHLIRIILVWEF